MVVGGKKYQVMIEWRNMLIIIIVLKILIVIIIIKIITIVKSMIIINIYFTYNKNKVNKKKQYKQVIDYF